VTRSFAVPVESVSLDQTVAGLLVLCSAVMSLSL
jgi:hypothetical protein